MTDWRFLPHPDAERFDAVTIDTVERWKESELSGDEWAGTGLRYVGMGRDDSTASTLSNKVRGSDDFEVVSSPDAARLRSLAATFDNRLNRDQSFTGAEVAAMLRDGGE